MKTNNRKDLQQIAIDHSADIYYKDFLNIYRNCTKKSYSFLTIDVHNPSMKFRKNFQISLIKMTLTELVKILDDKILANKVPNELDREVAKISALPSGELEKYEYLAGEDLGYKPDVIQKAKFEYSPLGNVFNEGLDESDKKEALLKRLKNIEGKNE